MRVNALFVAAMVITSVNAGWLDTFMGWFGIDRGNQGLVSSPNLPEHGPGSVLPSDSQDSTLDDARDLDPYNQEPGDGSNDGDEELTCDSIIADLTKLQVKMLELYGQFRAQLPAFYDLKSRAGDLKDEEMDDYHASRREVEAMLEGIKAEFTNSNARYSEDWATLIDKGCLDDYVYLMSPVEMTQISMFLDELQSSSGNEKIHGEDVVSLDKQ
ncbi:hypothetical protein BASA50_000294 [Batrachochytrium salamandrivorans]|uniref:Uncharacterized protein n=1 Tax=Batrachochytrium salamandrivorans TaxID=1357716 RepID=A0ABQ8EU88_9FUNG|nr:hypothetical protein BASA60_005855 [Batrachochytrium salamandrivorans]KAH6586697.1 hypothetical protein BASA50_000294 [Batrachochytrium salamandrivorans]